MSADLGECQEPELLEEVTLCTSNGRLSPAAIGWARRPLIDCSLPGSWGRRKRWDFWCVTGPGIAMNITYANVDYVGLADVWFHDFERDATATATHVVPFGRNMALHSSAGYAQLELRGRRLELSLIDHPDSTRLRASFPTRSGQFAADIEVAKPEGHESLTVVIPWSQRQFQCTTKDVARPARGDVQWGNNTYALNGGDAWGCLDFGRGKWPYRTSWNWGAGAGRVDGHTIGLQLGGKWTDGTGMTENALVVDGKLSKLSEELVWDYDPADWLSPWRIRTPRSDRLDLGFTPIYNKASRLEAGVAASKVNQCFGTYAGTIVPDHGPAIEVADVFGWAEEANWRW